MAGYGVKAEIRLNRALPAALTSIRGPDRLPLASRQAMPSIMPTRFNTSAALHPRAFGSTYDPVLQGVADGLAALFPPVHTPRRSETETETRSEVRTETVTGAAA